MQDTHIGLVQGSFAKVLPIKEAAAAIFYDRLFQIAPELRPLFTGDIVRQGAMLMATLATVVNGLRDLDRIVPVAQALAIRHVGYGVTPDHYALVGQALLDTLETGLGDGFDAPTREAWVAAYDTLSSVMIEAAYGNPVSV